MIIRMTRVDILGPKERLLDALARLRELGVMQLDATAAPEFDEAPLRPLHPDAASLSRHLYCEGLRASIAPLCALLPATATRPVYLDGEALLHALAPLAPRHLAEVRALLARREELQRQGVEYERRAGIFATLARLGEERPGNGGMVDMIGVTVREPALLAELVRVAEERSHGRFVLTSALAPDGTTVGLIATTNGMAASVRQILGEEAIAELTVPDELRDLPPARQAAACAERLADNRRALAIVAGELERFARRWRPFYCRALSWLDDRLALLRASGEVLETDYCFCIRGWLPSADVAPVRTALDACCGGAIVVEEHEVHEEDGSRVPVLLRNPPFVRPFEIFARLLPLPRYTSFDPTPFLALFVPVFFGLMLGDIGYGAVLATMALVLLWRRRGGLVHDAAWVLLVCAGFSILCGLAFGECFGEGVAHRLGLTPLVCQRSTALMPMLAFALAVGAAHITVGLICAIVTALRQGARREALAVGVQLVTLILLLAAVVSYLSPLHPLPLAPLLTALGLALGLLLVLGGLLAPLEVLKTVGNIVSYARLMAIGLTSVLLAESANRLAGMEGSILVGVLAGGLLHLFNLVLGVFAPTVHALRLHYVEFFGKFLEPGGASFRPLSRTSTKED